MGRSDEDIMGSLDPGGIASSSSDSGNVNKGNWELVVKIVVLWKRGSFLGGDLWVEWAADNPIPPKGNDIKMLPFFLITSTIFFFFFVPKKMLPFITSSIRNIQLRWFWILLVIIRNQTCRMRREFTFFNKKKKLIARQFTFTVCLFPGANRGEMGCKYEFLSVLSFGPKYSQNFVCRKFLNFFP